MPHMDIEATRYIKQLQNPPLVIIVTSDNAPECRALAKAVGADGFVDKGGDLRSLRSVFQELFHCAVRTLGVQNNQQPDTRVAAATGLSETLQVSLYADRKGRSI